MIKVKTIELVGTVVLINKQCVHVRYLWVLGYTTF